MDQQPFQPRRWTERLLREHERAYAYEGEIDEAFDDWQVAFRAELREALGHPRIERAGVSDLDPKRLAREEQYGYERSKWILETEPGLYVPFYLLLPDHGEPPYPVC